MQLKEIFVEQDSDDWHEERRQRIGASEVAAILGKSPYMTAYQLWKLKVGKAEPKPSNMAMERGKRLEAIAREMVAVELGMHFVPKVFVDIKMPFLMCSLDGLYNNNVVWECKAPSWTEHCNTTDGPPEKYYYQIQTQLMVTGAEYCMYTTIFEDSDTGGIDMKHCKVYPDLKAQKMVREEVSKFWDLVQKKEPPPLSEKDWKIDDRQEYKNLCTEYKKHYTQKKEAEAHMDIIKKRLIELSTHPRTECENVKVSCHDKKGRVNFDLLVKENNLEDNVEKYRMPPSSFWRVQVIS